MLSLACALAVQAQDQAAIDRAEARLREEWKRAMAAAEGKLSEVDRDNLAIQRLLDNCKIDLDFTDASLEVIVGFIREYAKVNMEIDARVREEGTAAKRITIKMNDALLRQALQAVCERFHCGFVIHDAVILIAKGPMEEAIQAAQVRVEGIVQKGYRLLHSIQEPDPADTRLLDELRTRRISMNSNEVPTAEMIGWIEDLYGIRIRVLPRAAEAVGKEKCSFRADDIPLESVLNLLTRMSGFTWVAHQGEVLLLTQGDVAGKVEGHAPAFGPTWKRTALGKNAQGCEEFRDEETDVVFVKVPARKGGHPFLLSKTTITNSQFHRFADIRVFAPGHDSGKIGDTDLNGDDLPVTSVTWYDIHGYLVWSGYRLPTEEEYEWAAWGDSKGLFPWGNDWPPPKGAGNFADATLGKVGPEWPVEANYDDGVAFLAPAGSASPNSFGLCDMCGNVWQWCGERFKPPIRFGPAPDAAGRFDESRPVLRGGAWCEFMPSVLARSARFQPRNGGTGPATGFRVAADCE